MRALAVVAVSAALGCADPPPVENPSPFDEDDPAAGAEPAPEPQSSGYALEKQEPAAEPVPATIERGALSAVLDRGPGAYSGSIGVEAVLESGAFRGWRVTRWDVGWPGIQPGDVVVDVNGVVVEKPSDLMALWDLLRDATEIAIRVERDGAVEVRRFSVE